MQTGLSNNSTGVANLATLSFEPLHGLTSDINYQTTTGSALVDDKFTYDGNLRSTGTTATWQSGSGSTGTVFSNLRTFDPVGNVGSVITTHAAVAGQSGSGGSSTQIFCYDEENRLVWAGDSSSAPAAGNGTCGSGTPANTLQGTSYNTTYAYTHLGQTWQSPLNGGTTQQQYLYCDSSHPHQLSGVYTVSSATTCANKGSATASYAPGYDAWGNQTTRSYNGQTAILSFNALDELTQWNAGSTSQGWYAYDNTDSRVLQRSTTSSGTTITVYAFGSEEHVYTASGAKLSDTYYYMLGGRLLGQYNGVTTQFYLTDALGSVVSTFDDTVGSAAILGNQAYGPYGKKIYSAGSMGTNKGYTGQYQDATGLDYYNARYYDSVIGRFVSADSVQGNTKGMDPYDYVGGNPETATDPTGHRIDWGGGEQTIIDWSKGTATTFETQQAVDPTQTDFWGAGAPYQYYKATNTADGGRQDVFHFGTQVSNPYNTHPVGATIRNALGITQIQHGDVVGGLLHGANNIFQLCMILCGGGEVEAVGVGAEEGGTSVFEGVGNLCGGGLSFTSTTKVTTDQGKKDIGSLKPGQKVLAYNPQTKKMELQPILHVWINHDNDLEDLTIISTVADKNGKPAQQKYETIHTNKKHPFLTQEYGFLPVSDLHVGMHIVKADGSVGTIDSWTLVPGTSVMYNLEVQQDHTFTVGDGQWVVHNLNCNFEAKQFATSIFEQLRKVAGLDLDNLTVSAAKTDAGSWLVAVNSRFGASRVVGALDPEAAKAAEIAATKGADYVGPTVFTTRELSQHAEIFIADHAVDNNIGIQGFWSATRNPCPECSIYIGARFPGIGFPVP